MNRLLGLLGGLFVFFCANAYPQRYSIVNTVTIRSMNNNGVLVEEITLGPSSQVSFDYRNWAGPTDYLRSDGSIATSRSSWYKGIQIDYSPGHSASQLRRINRKSLYLSATHKNDLRHAQGAPNVGRENEDGIAIETDNTESIRLSGEMTLRELVQTGGRNVLVSVTDLPPNSIIELDLRNEVGTMYYRNKAGEIKMSSRPWIRGPKLISVPGLSRSQVNRFNRKRLYISVDVKGVIDGGSGSGGNISNLRSLFDRLKRSDMANRSENCRDMSFSEFKQNAQIIQAMGRRVVSPAQYSGNSSGFDRFLDAVGINNFSSRGVLNAHHIQHAIKCGFRNGQLMAPRCRWISVAALLAVADDIRQSIGSRIIVRNWWRPRCYNSKVDGAADSDHIRARALDLDFVSVQARQLAVQRACRQIWHGRRHINVQFGVGAKTLHLGLGSPKGKRCWYYETLGRRGECRNPCR